MKRTRTMKGLVSGVLLGGMCLSLCSPAFAAAPAAEKPTIGMSGAVNGVYHAGRMSKYGSKTEVEIPLDVPDSVGHVRLADKYIEGKDLIKSVTLKENKLVIKAAFPDDLLEPEEYAVEVTLRGDDGEETPYRIEGSVYLQDSDGPVPPSDYREKKMVVVDFEENDCEEIRFKGGRLLVDGLYSGVANLDLDDAGRLEDKLHGQDVSYLCFLASPRLDREVTVCLDANPGDCVYDVSGDQPVRIDAQYHAADRELRFSTRFLSHYVLTDGELIQEETAAQPDKSQENCEPGKTNPGTGAYPEADPCFR